MRLSSSSDIPVSFGLISSAANAGRCGDTAEARATAAELFASTSDKNSVRVLVVIGALLFLLLRENADTRQLPVAANITMSNNEKAVIELILVFALLFEIRSVRGT